MTRCKSRNPDNKGKTRCYKPKVHTGPHRDLDESEWVGEGYVPPKKPGPKKGRGGRPKKKDDKVVIGRWKS